LEKHGKRTLLDVENVKNKTKQKTTKLNKVDLGWLVHDTLDLLVRWHKSLALNVNWQAKNARPDETAYFVLIIVEGSLEYLSSSSRR